MIDKRFFKERQPEILTALNNPLAGKFARKALDIYDDRKIVHIVPNGYHVKLSKEEYQFVGYSSDQHARALLKNGKWLFSAIHWWDMSIANRLVPSLNMGFDSYSSQPDGTAGLDTALDNGNTSTNYGSANWLGVGESKNEPNNIFRTLIEFDLTSVPDGAVWSAANLYTTIWLDIADNARTFRIYECLRNWVEAQATWNNYASGSGWTTAGAGSDGNDYDSTDLGNVSMGANDTGEKTWTFTSSGLTHLGTISGTGTNYGFVLRADTESNDLYWFYSSDDGTSTNRPKLTGTYSVPTAGGGEFLIFF